MQSPGSHSWRSYALACIGLVGLGTLPACQLATNAESADIRQTSHDGLVLVERDRRTALYVREGASLAQYRRIELLDCAVAFRKNWQRDRNAEQVGSMQWVSEQDMDRIRTELANAFRRVFTQELEKGDRYRVIDSGSKATERADDVLILRPAIIDLDVAAPNASTPGRTDTYSASAVAMTLYLELFDSSTAQILARYVNADGDQMGTFTFANSVTNMAAAERILARWAGRLRRGLDEANAHAASGDH